VPTVTPAAASVSPAGTASASVSVPVSVPAGALRAVHRVVGELRRGSPALLRAGAPLVLLATEAVTDEGLAEFAAAAGGPSVLLLAPSRAAALWPDAAEGAPPGGPVALALPDPLPTPALLRALADPTAEMPAGATLPAPVAAPQAAPAALTLAKLARLLPSVLAAPAREPLPETLLAADEADVRAYRDGAAASLTRVAEASVPLADAAQARLIAFRPADGGAEHLALLIGRPEDEAAPLVRLHSECFTGDLLGSLRCDCGPQLRGAIRRMARAGAGVLLYLAQEGRGIGLMGKLRAYALQDEGLDTVDANRALGWEADERNFLIAATMLRELGIARVRLLTNNPEKVAALAACGLAVTREAHVFAPNGVNNDYLATKAARFGHVFS
jgi:GTP cyclohydrolase II